MNLSQMSCSRGAPMGRRDHYCHGVGGIVFELEWVPFTDGGYDSQGAYWGSPDDLYCAVGTLDGEEVATHYIRAADRDEALAKLQLEMGYEDATMAPENGSLIKQMIEFLKAYVAGEPDEEMTDDAETEIEDLQMLLSEKGLT